MVSMSLAVRASTTRWKPSVKVVESGALPGDSETVVIGGGSSASVMPCHYCGPGAPQVSKTEPLCSDSRCLSTAAQRQRCRFNSYRLSIVSGWVLDEQGACPAWC